MRTIGAVKRSVGLALGLAALFGTGAGAEDAGPGDDLTFRPTVIVRKGTGQGSGTVIASASGETLVLTAAHVLQGSGAVEVEVHRYNLGVERALPSKGWPLMLPGEVAATDPAADVAVVRVRGRPPLPFVAKVAAPGDEPARGASVTSVGIDGGAKLGSWPTRVREVAWFLKFSNEHQGASFTATKRAAVAPIDPGERPFLVTARAPLPGRSGGGLFLDNGKLVGVCVGRIELGKGRALGLFASGESVRRLLRENDLEGAVSRNDPGNPGARKPRAEAKAKGEPRAAKK